MLAQLIELRFNGCFKSEGEIENVIFSNKIDNDMFGMLIRNEQDINSNSNSNSVELFSEKIPDKNEDLKSTDSETDSLIDLSPTAANPIEIPTSPSPVTTNVILPEPNNQSMPITTGL